MFKPKDLISPSDKRADNQNHFTTCPEQRAFLDLSALFKKPNVKANTVDENKENKTAHTNR